MKKMVFVIFLLHFLSIPPVFAREDGFVTTDDGVIHYQTYGSGTPLLIINGGPGLDCEGFAPLAELLSDTHLTILFDQRGTGQSSLEKIDNTTITMDLMIEDIEALRKHLQIQDWIVLGHSFGGWLAEYYASFYPERIRGMILSASGGIDLEILEYVGANINIRLSETQKESLNYWQEQIKQGDTSYHAKYKKGESIAPAYLYDRTFVPQLAERLAHVNLDITNLVYQDLHKIPFDCTDTLRDFARPVLIVQGRQDIVGPEIAYKAHSIFKNSKMVFLNECSHYGWLEQPELYKAEVDRFVASIDR